jgi:predicted transcriptional regulator
MAKKSFSLMLDEEIRARAERFAKAQDRSLGWWINNLMEREVRSLEDQQPSRSRKGREHVTDRSQAA